MSLVFNRKRAREFLSNNNNNSNNTNTDNSKHENNSNSVSSSNNGDIDVITAPSNTTPSENSASSSFVNPKHIINMPSLANLYSSSGSSFRFKHTRNLSNSAVIPENPFDNPDAVLEEDYPVGDPASSTTRYDAVVNNASLPHPTSNNPFADPINIPQGHEDANNNSQLHTRDEFFAPGPPSAHNGNNPYHINNNYTSSSRRPISNNSSITSQVPDPPARRYTVSSNTFYNNNSPTVAPPANPSSELPRLSHTSEDYAPIQNSFFKYSNVPIPIVTARRSKKNYSDKDGHYKVKENTLYANKRFKIKKILGQGTFSKVVQAYDYKNEKFVAIKIIKAIPKYREAATVELRVLSTLKMFDPENNNGCIQISEVFDYRNHISIVTDLLPTSVYDFMETNQFKSFSGSHIQSFVKQLLRSIVFLHDLNIIHTDLKPENILLLNDSFVKKPYYFDNRNVEFSMILKETKINLIDFGSAIFNDESHPDLITTRHYRAPEVTFGIGWSYECDLWSVGCILLELFIGDVFFDAHDNEEHLLMMEKAVGETIDMNLIMDCGINSLNDLNYLRSLRKPYSNYGNHYIHERQKRSLSFSCPSSSYSYTESVNGYGAIPKMIFSANNIDQLVYQFLEKRGADFTTVDRSYDGDRMVFKKRKLYDNEGNTNGNMQACKNYKKSSLNSDGSKQNKMVFPFDVSSKIRDKVGSLKSIQETICEKIDIDINYKIGRDFMNGKNNLHEEYFKYCLKFVDDESRKQLVAIMNLEDDLDNEDDQSAEQPGSSYYNAVVIDDEDDDDDDEDEEIYYDYDQNNYNQNNTNSINITSASSGCPSSEYMKSSVSSPAGSLSPWSSSSFGSFIAAGGSSTSPCSSTPTSGANSGSSSSSASSASSMAYKNLNSACGGILNSEFMKLVHFNNYTVDGQVKFVLTLKEQLEIHAKNNSNYNNVSKGRKIYCEILKDMVNEKYDCKLRSCKKFQTHELHKFEYHLNGQKIKIANVNGPVDFDCFKFWFYFIDLVKKLLVFNPYQRLTAYEAFNHEWFKLGIYDDGTCNSIN